MEIIVNIRKEIRMTKCKIEGEILDPIPEGAGVMRWFLDKYIRLHPEKSPRKLVVEFTDGLKDHLLKWVTEVEEDIYCDNPKY